MQCEICNRPTRINWGDSQHVLCETHCDRYTDELGEKSLSSSADSDRRTAKFLLIFFLVIEVILLPLWWGLLILSTLGSESNDYFLEIAPFAGYPVFIIVFLLLSLWLYRNQKRYVASSVSIVMPLVISFGYLAIISAVLG